MTHACRKLSEIEHDVVITTVSPHFNTTAFFFCQHREPGLLEVDVNCGLVSSQRPDDRHCPHSSLQQLIRPVSDPPYTRVPELTYGRIVQERYGFLRWF
jgi:hypothetical protein